MTEEATNTLEQPGEFDVLGKLKPDEIYFTLVSRDRLSPPLVEQWAQGNRKRALDEHAAGLMTEEQLDKELRKSTDAEKIAWAMKAQKERQEIDDKTGQLNLTAYTGHVLPEEVQRRDTEQRHRSRALTAIHNAISELTDAIPAFQAVGKINDVETTQATIDTLRDAADKLMVKRPVVANDATVMDELDAQ